MFNSDATVSITHTSFLHKITKVKKISEGYSFPFIHLTKDTHYYFSLPGKKIEESSLVATPCCRIRSCSNRG
jgi:hypothetical protein